MIMPDKVEQREAVLEERARHYPYKWVVKNKSLFYDVSTEEWIYYHYYGSNVYDATWHKGGLQLTKENGCSESAMMQAKNYGQVVYAGPVAGLTTGLYSLSKNVDILVTEQLDSVFLMDEPDEQPDLPQTMRFLVKLVGGEQAPYLLNWLWECCNPKVFASQILVLVGNEKTGSILQHYITTLVGGREKGLSRYLTDVIKHNVHLLGYEHLWYQGKLNARPVRLLQEFTQASRYITIPYSSVSFRFPELWQRISVNTADTHGLERLRPFSSDYLVLQLEPIVDDLPDFYLLKQEIDAMIGLGYSTAYHNEMPPSQAYWYPTAKEGLKAGMAGYISRLPAGWQGTTHQFKQLYPELGLSERQLGRQLTSFARANSKQLHKRLLHGISRYEKKGGL
jgi:hypothetical protein